MQVGTAPHSKNSNVDFSLENSQNCPVNATSKKNTATLIIIRNIVSSGLKPGGWGFASRSGSMNDFAHFPYLYTMNIRLDSIDLISKWESSG